MERMKFSSKANSFLSPINDIIKDKDIFIKKIEEIIKLPLNIYNFNYISKTPLIIKYKSNNKNVINKFCFYTKQIINIDNKKNKKTKESMMFDGFADKKFYDEKIIKNKFKLSDLTDKTSIINKTNEHEYNKDFHNSLSEENNEKDRVNINNDENISNLLKNNIIEPNKNISNNFEINNHEKDIKYKFLIILIIMKMKRI